MSQFIQVDRLSSLTMPEAEALLGKTISAITAEEYKLILTFSDGYTLTVRGASYDGCALQVDLDKLL